MVLTRSSPMRYIRWILLILYCLLVVGLVVFFGWNLHEAGIYVIGAVTVVSMVVFLSSVGIRDLVMPVHARQMILPLAIAGAMIAILVVSLAGALLELFEFEDEWIYDLLWPFLGLNWLGWAVLLYAYTKGLDRFIVIRRLAVILFAGSAAELIASIPAHLVVIRRPGCMVGFSTLIAITAGVCVMIWSFGPGIFLLFVYGRYQEEKKIPRCRDCGYDLHGADHERCPECGSEIPVKGLTGE